MYKFRAPCIVYHPVWLSERLLYVKRSLLTACKLSQNLAVVILSSILNPNFSATLSQILSSKLSSIL